MTDDYSKSIVVQCAIWELEYPSMDRDEIMTAIEWNGNAGFYPPLTSIDMDDYKRVFK